MSNPPSSTKPNPYFSGIIYNPTDYISLSSSSYITYSQAASLFIQKTIADSVSGITNFVNGITTSNIITKAVSTTCDLWVTSTSGVINIGTAGGRSAIIHIGDGNSNLSGSAVHINNGTNTVSGVNILNGTGSTGTIQLAASGGAISANCPLTLNYAPTLLTATSSLGYTTTDTITLTSLTSGTAVNLFSSNISLPAGVWLITYSLRLSSATNITFSSTNIYGIDNVNGTSIVYGQQGNNYGSANTVYAFTGTFIIKATAGSITSYNISFYSIYTTGSPALVITGALCSNIQRTRIG